MEWLGGLFVVGVILSIIYLTRKHQRDQMEDKVDSAANPPPADSNSNKPNLHNRAATAATKSDDLNQFMEQREAEKRDAFISKMKPFLERYGTKSTDVSKLLDYVQHKTGLGFNYGGVEWFAYHNGIRCLHEWSAHSFFDDGGGEEGLEDWSMLSVNSAGDGILQNEKLNDLNQYSRRYGGQFKDSFFCENPFGLKGLFKISYECSHEFTE